MMKMLKKIGPLTLALTLALITNFAYSAWTAPTATPPGNNVPAPLNTGPDIQIKEGQLQLRNGWPTLYLRDTDHRSTMLHANSGRFYVLSAFGNDSQDWWTPSSNAMISTPVGARWPLEIDLSSGDVYTGSGVSLLSNAKVAAAEYCDIYGNNCIKPGSFGGQVYSYYFGNINMCQEMQLVRCTPNLQAWATYPLNAAPGGVNHTFCFSGGNGSADENEGGLVYRRAGDGFWVYRQLWWHGGASVVHCI